MELPGDFLPHPAELPPEPSERRTRSWGWGASAAVSVVAALAGASAWLFWRAAHDLTDPIVAVTFGICGASVAVVWLLNLARWGLGVWRPARAIRVELCAGDARGLTFVFVELRWQGRLRCQQVVWEHWITNLPSSQSAWVRRCPGLRDMFLIDFPGQGRLWPARAAHGKPPWGVPIGSTTFHTGWFAAVGVVFWCVPGFLIIFFRWGTDALTLGIPFQLAILLMLGVAFSGEPADG